MKKKSKKKKSIHEILGRMGKKKTDTVMFMRTVELKPGNRLHDEIGKIANRGGGMAYIDGVGLINVEPSPN